MTKKERLQIEGARQAALEQARVRLTVVVILFVGMFAVLGLRTVKLGLLEHVAEPVLAGRMAQDRPASRADILDRNGVILARSLWTPSLYAEPALIDDPAAVAQKLALVLPELSAQNLKARFAGRRGYFRLKRGLTPGQQWQINAIGSLGLKFQMEEERVYPQGRLAAHVVGHVDADGRGQYGVEAYLDRRLGAPELADDPLLLALDIRVQHALTNRLRAAMAARSATAAAGLVLDVHTGEVLAMASLPDFDLNVPPAGTCACRFNHLVQGAYEMGSVFKTFTVAQGLEAGVVGLGDSYDATRPLRIASYTINDDHPKGRVLSIPEIFAYSSNIGSAQLADQIGGEAQRVFLGALGLLRPPAIELEDVSAPQTPERWRRVNTMTISYGYGVSVSPLQLASGVAAIVNDGHLTRATLVKQPVDARVDRTRVISAATSLKMRRLMRHVVEYGTGRNADVPGYRVGGKTGTARKMVPGQGYNRAAVLSSFVGVFPIDDPRFLVLVMLDEPDGVDGTMKTAGGGWVAAPVAAEVITRVAPMLGVRPAEGQTAPMRHAALIVNE